LGTFSKIYFNLFFQFYIAFEFKCFKQYLFHDFLLKTFDKEF